MTERRCLHCGMGAKATSFDLGGVPPRSRCAKCDHALYLQHDGSTLTGDIAHHHETVARAVEKLAELLLRGWKGYYRAVRIIVGGGKIREEVLRELNYYEQRGVVRGYRDDNANRGAIIAVLRGP